MISYAYILYCSLSTNRIPHEEHRLLPAWTSAVCPMRVWYNHAYEINWCMSRKKVLRSYVLLVSRFVLQRCRIRLQGIFRFEWFTHATFARDEFRTIFSDSAWLIAFTNNTIGSMWTTMFSKRTSSSTSSVPVIAGGNHSKHYTGKTFSFLLQEKNKELIKRAFTPGLFDVRREKKNLEFSFSLCEKKTTLFWQYLVRYLTSDIAILIGFDRFHISKSPWQQKHHSMSIKRRLTRMCIIDRYISWSSWYVRNDKNKCELIQGRFEIGW